MWNDPRFGGFLRRVWEGCEVEDEHFTVHNFAHDGRVCEAFRLALLALIEGRNGTTPREDFLAFQALAKRFEGEIRSRPLATFCSSSYNRPNLLDEAEAGTEHGVTVVNLSKMLVAATSLGSKDLPQQAVHAVNASLSPLGLSTSASLLSIRERLERIDFNEARMRVAVLLLQRTMAEHLPRHPVWVASFTEFEELVDWTKPGSWLEAVGLPAPRGLEERRFLVVLKYNLGDLPVLVRPSQVEAGWFAFHFPTPSAMPVSKGGRTMRLGGVSWDRRKGDSLLVPEFIHEQVPFRLAAEEEIAGSVVVEWVAHGMARGDGKAGVSLGQCRGLQHRRLRKGFPRETTGWMPDPLGWPK